MAGDSFVQIDEGSARKMDTWQRAIASNTVEQQRYVQSEPYQPSFSISVTTAISAATANAHLLQIMAGPLNRVGIRRLRVYQVANGTTQQTTLQVRRLTTAGTGGTSYTPAVYDPSDTTDVTAMTLPSAKGTEGAVLWNGSVLFHATAATVGLNPVLELDWTMTTTKALWIPAGTSNGLCIKNVTGVTSATVFVWAEFVEQFWA